MQISFLKHKATEIILLSNHSIKLYNPEQKLLKIYKFMMNIKIRHLSKPWFPKEIGNGFLNT